MVFKKFYCINLVLLLAFLVCCKPNNKDNIENNDKALDAFSKIDKQGGELFTKNDRIAAYKNSIETSENQTKSLNKKSTYNGYGSQNKSRKINTKNKSAETKKNKKTSYSFKKGGSTQTFSTYSTN
tara:strand:- start:434 stop:811 length:378 start_codon:yes stop_codon:yes gene_type:complete